MKSNFRLISALAVGVLGILATGSGFPASDVALPFKVPDPAKVHNPFTFAVYGDIQDVYQDGHRKLVNLIKKDEVAFIINTGDISPDGGGSYEKHFYPEFREISELVPFYPASGNHDVEWLSDASRRPYLSFFRNAYQYLATQPFNGHIAPDSQKLWYSFRHATSLFLALDSNLMIDTGRYGRTHALAPYRNYAEEQLHWTQKVLEEASQDPTIKTKYVFFHHSPFFSKETEGFGFGGHEDDRELMVNEGVRDATGSMVYLLDLFRQYRVNAVFSGHEHYYERWRETIDEKGKPVHTLDWVVVGSGGVKPRSSYDYGDRRMAELFKKGSVYDRYLRRISGINNCWTAKLERVYPNRENPSAKIQSYTHVSVDGPEVRFETREANGATRDAGFFSR